MFHNLPFYIVDPLLAEQLESIGTGSSNALGACNACSVVPIIRFAGGRIIALGHSDVVTYSHFCAQKMRCIRVGASRLVTATGILDDVISVTAQNPVTELEAFRLNNVRRMWCKIAFTKASHVDSRGALIWGDLEICVNWHGLPLAGITADRAARLKLARTGRYLGSPQESEIYAG